MLSLTSALRFVGGRKAKLQNTQRVCYFESSNRKDSKESLACHRSILILDPTQGFKGLGHDISFSMHLTSPQTCCVATQSARRIPVSMHCIAPLKLLPRAIRTSPALLEFFVLEPLRPPAGLASETWARSHPAAPSVCVSRWSDLALRPYL